MLPAEAQPGGFKRGAHQVFYGHHVEDAENIPRLPQAAQRGVAEADPGAAGIKDSLGKFKQRAQAIFKVNLFRGRISGLAGEDLAPARCRTARYFGVIDYPLAFRPEAGRLVKGDVREIMFGSLLKRNPVPVVARRDPQVARRL